MKATGNASPLRLLVALCLFALGACVIPLRGTGSPGDPNNTNNQNNCNNQNNNNQNGDGSSSQTDGALDAAGDAPADARADHADAACDGAICPSGCTDLSSDPRNCGSCGNACGSRQVCFNGRCENGCPDGQTFCRDRCTDLHSDPANCGACDQACASRPHGVTVCADGGCAFVCESGAADCDLVIDNGCEVDLATDVAHCGRCGHTCATGEVCRAAACAVP